MSLWRRIPAIPLPAFAATTPMPLPVFLGLVSVIGLVAYGLVLLFTWPKGFWFWIQEDRLVEWLTVLWLALMAGLAAYGAWTVSKKDKAARRALWLWLFLAAVFCFGALEEISYGQRIFGTETPSWLVHPGPDADPKPWIYNRQSEHNFHNLILFGVNINKLIFGKILALLLVLYFGGFPLLFRFSTRFRDWTRETGIPVPQNYQIVLIALFALSTYPFRHTHGYAGKVMELMEFGGTYTLLMCMAHPRNPPSPTRPLKR
ncbi:MAG: hypothetical protein ACYTHM_05955 [Planctomycetota bacterium]|jgi:hypothetical protein